MAKALLLSVAPEDHSDNSWSRGAYTLLRKSALDDRIKVHELTDDPIGADVIVFAELGYHGIFSELIRSHPYVRKYREKCFLFDPQDFSLPFLPGIYASIPKHLHDEARTRGGYYLNILENPFVQFDPNSRANEFLGSFIGSIKNHPVRRALEGLPKDAFNIQDTSPYALRILHSGSDDERRAFWSRYAHGIGSALFSLCPRGIGSGSIRLFETMKMGRVPVIISDDWVRPPGVDWEACSLSIPENEVHRLPELLAASKKDAARLGLNARTQWENRFAPDVIFHHLISDCLDLQSKRTTPEWLSELMIWRHVVRPSTFRMYMSSKRQLFQKHRRLLL